VVLANPAFSGLPGTPGIGCRLSYDARAMPAFYQWQNLHEGDYVMGLEPATCHAGSREDWKSRDELAWLDYAEAREYRLTLEALAGEAELEAATRSVALRE
jgi:hypothetical protein